MSLSPSEQFSQEARQEARNSLPRTVAAKLRERRGLLIAGGYVQSPPEPDWDALANEAITRRTIAGVPLSQLKDDNGVSLDTLVPTTQRGNAIAEEVALAVGENTGSMSFLKGATIGQAFRGLWEMIKEKGIGAAISGVFNMIFSDGQSQDAKDLTKFIGIETANDIGEGVTARLKARQQELGLTDAQIQEISTQSQNSVRQKVGAPQIAPPPSPVQGPVDANGLTAQENQSMRGIIQSQVLGGLGLKNENGQIVVDIANTAGMEKLNLMAQAAGVPNNQFSAEQRTAIANTMTDALQQVALTQPPLRNARAISAAIKTKLATQADAMGFGNMPPADRDAMLQMMANEMTVSYMKARPIDRAAGEEFERTVAPENAALKRQLMMGRIRPVVAGSLGMAENPPGTFTNVSPANGEKPKIEMLEAAAGGPLDNAKRGAIVGTLSDTISDLASRNVTDPNAIREAFKRNLEAKKTEMGFDRMSAQDRDKLFTIMANESTESYLRTAVNTDAADQFRNTHSADTERLKTELIVGQIRPGVIAGFNMREEPAGTFVNNDPAPPKQSVIKQLEQVAGKPLTNEQRTALVNTMSNSLRTIVETTPKMSIEQTRNHIETQLMANADAMGFGALSEEEKRKLFRRMANESTVTYIEQMNVGTATERAAFKQAAETENATITRELTPGAVRRNLNNMLDPNTQAGRDALGMLTMAAGSNSFNRESMINALEPALTNIALREPKLRADNPTDLAIASAQIEAAIRNANPPTGIPLNETPQPGKKTRLQEVSETIARGALGGSTPSTSPGQQLVGVQWDEMMNGFKQRDPQLYDSLNGALHLDNPEGIRANIATALDNAIRNNPDFHSKTPAERREILKAAIVDSLRNGQMPDGGSVQLGGPLGGMRVDNSVARNSLADLMADKMVGIENDPRSYMPRPGTPGVHLTGALAPVEDVANATGLQPHLQNFDVGQVQGIVTDIGNGNIGSGLSRAGDGIASVWNYWTR